MKRVTGREFAKVLERNGWPHLAPFGYKNVHEPHSVEPEPEEAKAVRWLFHSFASGEYSVDRLRTHFHDVGFRYRSRNGTMRRSTLYRLLRNPFYKGMMLWKGRLYPGGFEPLVDNRTWDRVQGLLDGNLKPKKSRHDFTYRGLLRCSHCGCMITAEIKKGRYVYYHCTSGRGRCENKWVREDVLDEVFIDALRAIQLDEGIAELIAEGVRELHDAEIREREEEVRRLKRRIDRLQAKIQAAYNDKLEGKIEESFWREQHDRMIAERDRALRRVRGSMRPIVASTRRRSRS